MKLKSGRRDRLLRQGRRDHRRVLRAAWIRLQAEGADAGYGLNEAIGALFDFSVDNPPRPRPHDDLRQPVN
jgi:hypothetical protein